MKIRIFLLCLLPFASARTEEISYGKWTLSINRDAGRIERLSYSGEQLADRMETLLKTEKKTAPRKLKQVRREKNVLLLDWSYAPWNIAERIEFDACGVPGLLKQSCEVLYSPRENTGEPEAFHGVISELLMPKDRDYYLPGAICGDTRRQTGGNRSQSADQHLKLARNPVHHRGSLKNLPEKMRLTPAFTSHTILLQTPAPTSLAFIFDERREFIYLTVGIRNGKAFVKRDMHAHGWAYPGKPQTGIGPVYLQVLPGTKLENALAEALPRWYRAIGALPPENRSPWIYGAGIYELHPRFGVDQGLLRAGDLIPRAKALGFNTLHVMPVQDGPRHWYNPRHFFRIDRHAGTPDDLRTLVNKAHSHGMKAWVDLVPHGGELPEIMQRGTPAYWIPFSRKGEVFGRYPNDYKQPEYQDYICRVTEFYMKEYGLDGFRVDQPWGSQPNWRKKNYPAKDKVPKGLTAEFYRKSLAVTGGEMQPLEYERASLALREGGFEMCERIRNTVKKCNPSGAVLTETLSTMNPLSADLMHDQLYSPFGHKFRELDIAECVPALSRYLEEKKLLFPPGTRFMRMFQNHDQWNPFEYFGTGLGRAAFASTVLMDGATILLQYSDTGHGDFLTAVNSIRNSRPELQFGDASYLAVKSSRPEVWTVLRRWKGVSTIGLVNFSNNRLSTEIRVAADGLKLDPARKYRLSNLLNGKQIAAGTPAQIAKFTIELAPYETAVLSTAEPRTENNPPPKPETPAEKLPSVEEINGEISVSTRAYRLSVNKKTGLLSSFLPAGTEMRIMENEIIVPRKIDGVRTAETTFRKENGNIRIRSRQKIGGEFLETQWLCRKDDVQFSAKLSGKPDRGYFLLAFPAGNAYRWQVHTAEGVLGEPFWNLERQSALIKPSWHSQYRNRGQEILLWDAEKQLPAPTEPTIALFDRNGYGFKFEIDDFLNRPPAGMVLAKRLGDGRNPAFLLYLRNTGALAADAKPEVSFTLRPAKRNRELFRYPAPLTTDGVSFHSESTGYVIENEHYRLRLDRLSGSMRELVDKKSGRRLLESQKWWSIGIDHNKYHTGSLFSNFYDMNGGVRIFRDGGTLKLRFMSIFHGPGFFSLPHRRLWCVTEYAFNRSGTFSTAYYFQGDNQSYAAPLLEWEALVPESLTLKQTASDTIRFESEDGTANAVVSEIRGAVPAMEETNLKLSVFDGKKDHFIARKYYPVTFTLSVGTPSPAPEIRSRKAVENSIMEPDGSFESLGSAWMPNRNREIPFPLPADRPGCWTMGRRGILNYDRTTAADGNVSLRVYDNAIINFPLPGKYKGGKYKLVFFIQGENRKLNRRMRLELNGSGANGGRLAVSMIRDLPGGSFPWQKVEIPFRLPRELVAPNLQIYMEDIDDTGILRLDDFKIIPEPL